MKVRDVKDKITREAAVVREDSTLRDITRALLEDPKTQAVYVVNSEGKLVGIITIHLITQYAYSEHIPPEYLQFRIDTIMGEKATAADIMLPPVFVKEDDDLGAAFAKMFENQLAELPVVNEELKIVGDLHQLELLKVWLENQAT